MAIWNEEYYNGLLSSLDEVLQAQQRDVIAVICRRLKAVGELNPTSVKQLVQLARWQRADLAEIKKLIRKYSGLSAAEVEKAFKQAAKDSAEYADVLAQQAKGVTYAANTELLAKAAAKTYVDEILNMSDTYAFKTSFGTLPIRQTYIKAVNKAVAAVSTGTLDYNTAIQQTIKELADSGLRNVYIDGDVAPAKVRWMNENGETYYTRRVDSSVRMNVLEGVRRINQEILNDSGEKYATGYEISAHDRPAPDHADIQGRQYTTAAFEQLNASLVRPIGTLNCMHIAFPIIYGVSKPAYTDEQLAEFKANAGKQYEYKGKTLSGYECTQQQRKYETAIRRAKDRANAFEAAGDKTNAARERRRARELGREYREFSEHVGLSVKAKRLNVNKTNPDVANKAKAIDIFNSDGHSGNTNITPDSVLEDLMTTEIGKETIRTLENLPQRATFDYINTPVGGLRGYEKDGRIILYANNCKDIKTAACTLIHECTHYKYGIGQSQWAECVCVAQEIKHRRNRNLTFGELRMIIKAVKDVYPEYNWRKGGTIRGRRQ